jgi:hypothetical protein
MSYAYRWCEREVCIYGASHFQEMKDRHAAIPSRQAIPGRLQAAQRGKRARRHARLYLRTAVLSSVGGCSA